MTQAKGAFRDDRVARLGDNPRMKKAKPLFRVLLLTLPLLLTAASSLQADTPSLQADTPSLQADMPSLQADARPPQAGIDSQRLSAFVERGMELWQAPGLAVAVVSSDEVLYQRGFGTTAIKDGAPVDQHTLFANASTTKAMVAAGLLMLVDEGQLGLDDAAARHLPELQFSDPLLTRELTLRDLLSHRSGLPSTDFWTFFQDMPLAEQVERLAAVEAAAPLRTRHIYQNTMYELAGLIIERVSGQRWDRFLAERLWRPIGMHETFGARGQIGAELSHVLPHGYADGKVEPTDWDLPADLADAAGSAWTSLHDMSLWAQFLLRGGMTADGQRLLSEGSFKEFFKPQMLIGKKDFYPVASLTEPHWRSYALGWFQQDFQGRPIDFHTGSLSGLIAIIGLDRAGDRAVIVLGNRDHAELRHAILWEVMDRNPAGERRDWNQAVFDLYRDAAAARAAGWQEKEQLRLRKTKPALPLAAYAGRYENPALGTVTIEVARRDMLLRTARLALPMSHWHLDTFLVEHAPWELREFAEFRIAPDGKVASFDLFGETFTAGDGPGSSSGSSSGSGTDSPR
jgi:CubicO group peptidase (beta-lactamase class C family)